MPELSFFGFIINAFAACFIISPLFSFELNKQVVAPRKEYFKLAIKVNYYFYLALLVCVSLLCGLYLFVPYAKYFILALAVCGLSNIIMEIAVLLRCKIFKKASCFDFLQNNSQIRTDLPTPRNFEHAQIKYETAPAQTISSTPVPPTMDPDIYKRFY